MALKRWMPGENMERFFHDLLDETMPGGMARRFPSLRAFARFGESSPAVDMYDNKNEIVVKAEVPGVDKDNLNISISDNMLTIKGEMKREEETREEDYYYSERSYGSFMRVLNLPAKVNEKKVKASFKDGVLEIHMPKAAESKPKDIKVEIS